MKKTALLLLCIALLSMTLLACTSSPYHREKANAFKRSGMALIEAGQYTAALRELLEADKYSSRDAEIKYYLGVAYHGRGLRDQAMRSFQQAISLKRDYSEAHNYLGTLYMDMGQWEEAVASFDRALANYLYDTPAVALYNSGWAYYNLKDYPKSLSRYQQAIRNDPLNILRPQIEKNIGLIHIAQNNLVGAIAHLKTAVDLEPAMFDAYFFLGESYYKIKDRANAKKAFQKVIDLAPQSPFAMRSREYLATIR